jgi:competence protein ComEA
MTAYCVRTSRWGAAAIELERQPARWLDYVIDLNSATSVEWSQLPGIGPVLADRIVAERDNNGEYRDVEDLRRVKGMGPQRIETIRPYVRNATIDRRFERE